MTSVQLKLISLTIGASVLALTSHILLSSWADPRIAELTQGITGAVGDYSFQIKLAAYATSFIQVGVVTIVYYYAGHLLTLSNKLAKILVLTGIILEVKGALLRQPLMDYLVNLSAEGMNSPATFVFLSNIDKWVANLVLAACLVYFCPLKSSRAGAPSRL